MMIYDSYNLYYMFIDYQGINHYIYDPVRQLGLPGSSLKAATWPRTRSRSRSSLGWIRSGNTRTTKRVFLLRKTEMLWIFKAFQHVQIWFSISMKDSIYLLPTKLRNPSPRHHSLAKDKNAWEGPQFCPESYRGPTSSTTGRTGPRWVGYQSPSIWRPHATCASERNVISLAEIWKRNSHRKMSFRRNAVMLSSIRWKPSVVHHVIPHVPCSKVAIIENGHHHAFNKESW